MDYPIPIAALIDASLEDDISVLHLGGHELSALSRLGVQNIRQFIEYDLNGLENKWGTGKQTATSLLLTQEAMKQRLICDKEYYLSQETPMKAIELGTKQNKWLARNEIFTIGDFLSLNLSSQSCLHSCGYGARTISQLKAQQCILSQALKQNCVQKRQPAWFQMPAVPETLEMAPLFSGATCLDLDANSYHKSYLASSKTEDLDLNVRSNHALESLGITTIGQLLCVSPIDILSQKGLGKGTIKHIQNTVRTYILSGAAPYSDVELDMSSFSALVNSCVTHIVGDGRYTQILVAHISPEINASPTLEAIGALFGVTRERIRQVITPNMERLQKCSDIFQPLFAATQAEVNASAGFMTADALCSQIKNRFGWNSSPPPKALCKILSFSNHYLVLRDRYICLAQFPCHTCITGKNNIQDALQKVSSIPLSTLSFLVQQLCTRNCPKGSPPHLSCPNTDLITFLIRTSYDISEAWRIVDNNVMSNDEWNLKKGSIRSAAISYLKLTEQPLHFSDIYRHLGRIRERENIDEHGVYAALGSSDDCLLWDRGTYIHKEHVRLPVALLNRIASWIVQHLKNNDIPFISAEGPYSNFRDECKEAGMPSAYSLYSCLKQNNQVSLAFPRAPYIHLQAPDAEHIPLAIALEEWILYTGRIVPATELKELVAEKMFLKDFQWSQVRRQISNMIRTKGHGLLHVQNFDFHSSSVEDLVQYIHEELRRQQQVPVTAVYKNRKLTCRMANIDSPHMLYSALSFLSSSNLSFPGYPSICKIGADDIIAVKTVVDQVVAYILNAERPCSYQELEDHFIDKHGFDRQRVIYVYAISNNVTKYLKHSLIHMKTLGWSIKKQSQLELLAIDAYQAAVRQGNCFASLRNFLEEYETRLPALSNECIWTCTLLDSLLSKGDALMVLGNGRDAFIVKDNELGITCLDDLIVHILRNDFGGGANLKAFSAHMAAQGIVKKSVTPVMIRSGRVAIESDEIKLTELMKC